MDYLLHNNMNVLLDSSPQYYADQQKTSMRERLVVAHLLENIILGVKFLFLTTHAIKHHVVVVSP